MVAHTLPGTQEAETGDPCELETADQPALNSDSVPKSKRGGLDQPALNSNSVSKSKRGGLVALPSAKLLFGDIFPHPVKLKLPPGKETAPD